MKKNPFIYNDINIDIEKAYTEGIYSDTPANRKLGRVGMSYKEWEKKQGKKEEKIDNISLYRLGKILNNENIFPANIRDHKEYFLISLDDFGNKEQVNKTKEVLENLGAKVYISSHTHFIKAFKKDTIVEEEKYKEVFKIGNFKFDFNTRSLINKEGNIIDLTPKEAELLRIFASNPNKDISRDNLLDKVWGESNYYTSRSMDVYITKLRDKLSGDKDIRLVTLPWRGYKLFLPKSKEKTSFDRKEEIKEILDKTSLLKKLTTKDINILIENSNSVKGVKGIKLGDKATEKEKKEAIAEFYINTFNLEEDKEEDTSSLLDEVIADSLKNYTSKEKNVYKKINDYFGFEDEKGEWFADTPIALTMSDDKEFGEVINEFTDYQILSQSGSYKNDGSRSTMLRCNVEYEIIPKGTADEDVELSKKTFVIDKKTTIKDILKKLGSRED